MSLSVLCLLKPSIASRLLFVRSFCSHCTQTCSRLSALYLHDTATFSITATATDRQTPRNYDYTEDIYKDRKSEEVIAQSQMPPVENIIWKTRAPKDLKELGRLLRRIRKNIIERSTLTEAKQALSLYEAIYTRNPQLLPRIRNVDHNGINTLFQLIELHLRDVEVSLTLARRLVASGVRLWSHDLESMMRVASSQKYLGPPYAERMMRTMIGLHRVIPRLATYNLLIREYCVHGELMEAERVLRSIEEDGLTPNAHSYMLLAIGYTNAEVDQIDKSRLRFHLKNFVNCEGLVRSEVESIIKHATQAEEYEEVLWLIDEVRERHGITTFSSEGWNEVLKAFVKTHKMTRARALLEAMYEMEETSRPNLESYRILILGYLQLYSLTYDTPKKVKAEVKNDAVETWADQNEDMENAVALFRDMPMHGIRPDASLYMAFIKAKIRSFDKISSANRDSDLVVIHRLYNAMIRSMGSNERPDNLASLAWFYTYAEQPRLAEEIKLDMHRLNIHIKLPLYHALARSFVKSGKVLSAVSLFYDMIERGDRPSSNLTMEVMESFVAHGDVRSAWDLVRLLKETGHPVRSRFYDILVRGWVEINNISAARQCWEEMIELGLKPSVAACNAILDGYWKQQDHELAERFYHDEILSRQVTPNKITYHIILRGYGAIGRIDCMESVLKDMRNADIPLTLQTYSILIAGQIRAGNLESAYRDFLYIVKAQPFGDPSTARELARIAMAEEGVTRENDGTSSLGPNPTPKEITTVLNSLLLAYGLRAHDHHSPEIHGINMLFDYLVRVGLANDRSYQAMVIVCGKIGMRERAREIYWEMVNKGWDVERGLRKILREWEVREIWDDEHFTIQKPISASVGLHHSKKYFELDKLEVRGEEKNRKGNQDSM